MFVVSPRKKAAAAETARVVSPPRLLPRRLRLSGTGLTAVFTALTVLLAAPLAALAADKKGVEELGKLIKKKPTYILSNVKLTGRMKSLITEMKLKDGFNELPFDTTDINPKALEKASILILVDRESGELPAESEFLLPAGVKASSGGGASILRGNRRIGRDGDSGGSGSNAAFMVVGKEEKGFRSVLISAPTRDALISFIDTDIRNYRDQLKKHDGFDLPALQVAKPIRPSAPELLYPVGTVRSTRPPIFFLANRTEEKITFDLHMAPGSNAPEVRRDDFSKDGDTFQAPDGGWVAFDQTVRTASQYQLDIWGVKPPKGWQRENKVIYYYEPEYDVRASATYTVRIRGSYPNARDSKPGMWTSDEEEIAFAVPPQPENLGASESLSRTDDKSQVNYPVYSPDGKMLIYSTNRGSANGNNIWEIYADDASAPGTGSVRLTSSNRGSRDLRPTWGPNQGDGVGYMTFSRYERDSQGGRSAQNLWFVAVPTAAKPDVPIGYTQLTNFPEPTYAPTWSPDGKRCAFCKDNGRGDTEIWIVEVGKNPRVLTTGITPAWAPDGRTLYYSSNANGTYDIWSIDTLSGTTKAITSDPGSEVQPSVNPTGNGDLAYVSTASGNDDIWVLRGRNAVQLTQWLGNDSWPTWTPDGKKIVFSTTRFSSKFMYGLASIDAYGTNRGVEPERVVEKGIGQ